MLDRIPLSQLLHDEQQVESNLMDKSSGRFVVV
jgi:hypothetical protein